MYRNKKGSLKEKLSTNDNMDRVNDIIGEIEGRIGSLKEDSIKAKEYLKFKERYKELEINMLKNIENIESKNRYIKEDITELSRNIDGLKKNRSELERKIRRTGDQKCRDRKRYGRCEKDPDGDCR